MEAFKKNKPPAYDANRAYQTGVAEDRAAMGLAAAYNRPNQRDQFGNTLEYRQTGTDAAGNPMFEQSVTMGDTARQYDTMFRGLADRYGQTAGTFDFDYDTAMAESGRQADAAMGERFARDEAAARNRLANQGFDINAEAYNTEMGDLYKAQQGARSDFVRNYAGQLFNQELGAYRQNIGDLSAGLGYGQAAIGGDFAPVTQVQGSNETNAYDKQFDANYRNYQEKQREKSAALGGLASIGGTLANAGMRAYFGR